MRNFRFFCSVFCLLACCSCNSNTSFLIEETNLEYPHQIIEWDELFSIREEKYYVYVYSLDCYYCKEIKQDVLEFYQTSENSIFFIEYSESIPIKNDIEKTIGERDICNLFIKGTPTLIEINKGSVNFNVAGKSKVIKMIDLINNQ